MNKSILLLMLLLACFSGNVHAQGIQFWKGSFDSAVQEAERQEKLIFIDFYTVWCGPCKMLAKDVFPQKEVGDFFNKSFICCQLDAEKEGKDVALRYEVHAYPTLVLINSRGEMVAKTTGVLSAEELIAWGQKAMEEMKDPDNIVNLRERYKNGERSEEFLRLYIEKMKENKMDPGAAIEEYLKIQKSMPENSSRMMEFFLDYNNYFVLGGEAERIFQANKKEYMDIATQSEERKIGQIYAKMMRRTQGEALANRDVATYELFLDRWVKWDEKPYYQDYNDLRLDLYLLKGEMKEYRKSAFVYLDSIVDSRTVEDIHQKDQERFDEYCKANPGSSWLGDIMKESTRNLDAKLQTQAIIKVGTQLLKDAKRKDFKRFPKWIEHGKQLLPEDYQMTNFEAAVLYRQGKKKEAIETKQKALDMMNPNDKVYPTITEELKKMQNGTF